MSLEFLFVLSALACFRLSRLISDDKIFDWLRKLPPPKSKTKELVTCPFCTSFYFATGITICEVGSNLLRWELSLLWMSAIWGGSILLNQLFLRLSK